MPPALRIMKTGLTPCSGSAYTNLNVSKNKYKLCLRVVKPPAHIATQSETRIALSPNIKATKARDSVLWREPSPHRRELYQSTSYTNNFTRSFRRRTNVEVTVLAHELQRSRGQIYKEWRKTDSFGLTKGAGCYMKNRTGMEVGERTSKMGALVEKLDTFLEGAEKKGGKEDKDSEAEGVKEGKGVKIDETGAKTNEDKAIECAVRCPGCEKVDRPLQSGNEADGPVRGIENEDEDNAKEDEEIDAVWGRGGYPYTRIF